jgi:murein DD-endopeptidase MepM/ murein hydrolase activator NlpD
VLSEPTSDHSHQASDNADEISDGPDPDRAHPIRDRLLARAAEARRGRLPELVAEASGGGGLDEIGREGRRPADLELDAIASPSARPPSAPVVRRQRPQLTPNMVALFGALLGLATVASLVALAMNLDVERPAFEKAESEAPAAAEGEPDRQAESRPKRRERKKLPGPWRIEDAKGQAGVRIVEGSIGREPFLRAVQGKGLAMKEAYRVLTALKGLKNLDKCDKNDRFLALLDSGSGRVKAFEYIVNKEEIFQAREGDDGLLGGRKLELEVRRDQVRGAFVVNGSFRDSALAGGFEPGLAKAVSEALDGHLNLEELERGDRMRVIAQEVTVLGEFSRYAGVETVEIVFAKKDKKPLRVYYFQNPRARGYYDASGRAPYEGGWRNPIPGAPVTSKFNPKRLHPVLKKVMPHTGTDFGAPSGTPVGASSFGTVSFIGYAGPSGNLVKIDHPGGMETGYAHLSRFAEGMKVGDKVTRLQLIGYVGSTGRSTGPHLHFTAKKNGQYIDAETLNLDAMRVLPKEYREEFAQAKAKYDAMLDATPLPDAPADAPEPEPAEATARGDEEPASGVGMTDDYGDDGALEAEPVKPAAAKASAKGGSAVYLTDEELLKIQGRSDDGEVEY